MWARSSRLAKTSKPSCCRESREGRHRRRTTRELAQDRAVLVDEGGVAPRVDEGGLELETGRHQRLGDEASAEVAEATVVVGSPMKTAAFAHCRILLRRRPVGRRRTKCVTVSRSLTPGDDSTPVAHVDAPGVDVAAMTSATFSGVESAGGDDRHVETSARRARPSEWRSPLPGVGAVDEHRVDRRLVEVEEFVGCRSRAP